MERALVLGAGLLAVVATAAACGSDTCMAGESAACSSHDNSNAHAGDDSLACDELDLHKHSPIQGVIKDGDVWNWRHCYRFELRENAWLKLTSNTTEHAVPNFKLYPDTGDGVFPISDPGIDESATGEFSRPLPKGSYAFVLTSALAGPYEFNIAADAQAKPSPKSDPADIPSERADIVPLMPSPTAEIRDYVGTPDGADFFSLVLDRQSTVVLGFGETKILGFGAVNAELFVDHEDGTATAADSKGMAYVDTSGQVWPAKGELPAGKYLVKVYGNPSLYTLTLNVTDAL